MPDVMPERSKLFSRNLKRRYPIAMSGEGCWITDSEGRKYLDASGQAAVVNIGHGVKEIGAAMAAQSNALAFAHTSQFHSAGAEKLAARLLALAPPSFRAGGLLRRQLQVLATHKNVGEVRGLGLLLAVEFVKDKGTREPFAKEENIAERIRQAALSENVLTYPTQGCVDGMRGDHVLLAPPFIISAEESATIAGALETAIGKVLG